MSGRIIFFFCFPIVTLIISCDNSSVETGEKDTVSQSGQNIRDQEREKSSRARAEELIRRSGERNQLHITAGNMAIEKAQNQSVREFSHRMVRDHSIANEELKSLAAKRSVNIPDTLAGRRRQIMEELDAAKGLAFDKAYLNVVIETHREDIRKFTDFLKDIDDKAVRQWGATMVKQMEEHLEMALETQKELKSKR